MKVGDTNVSYVSGNVAAGDNGSRIFRSQKWKVSALKGKWREDDKGILANRWRDGLVNRGLISDGRP